MKEGAHTHTHTNAHFSQHILERLENIMDLMGILFEREVAGHLEAVCRNKLTDPNDCFVVIVGVILGEILSVINM